MRDGKGRLYISSDRGNSWTWVNLPFPVGGNDNGRAVGERLKLDPTNPSTMFYATRTAGLWKSTDSGQTWNQTRLSSKQLTADEISHLGWSTSMIGVEQIMFDNSNVGGGDTTWIMYAAVAPDYAQVAGLTSTMYKSVDGGYSWTPVAVPSTVAGYYIPHMARSNDGNYYVVFNKNAGQGAGGPGYLYKFGGTTNGDQWSAQPLASTTDTGFGGVSVYGTGPTTRVALSMMSDNAGGAWREIAGGMEHWGGEFWGWVDDVEIDPTNPKHIMHVTGGGVWETWDATLATPSWDFPNNNLEETVTLALVTPPAGTPYKFINAAGDVGTWVQTDLATKPTRGPSNVWNNGNSADMAWSDPNYIATTGVINTVDPHVGTGYWSGDGGVTWSTFATLPPGAAAATDHSSNIAVTARNKAVWAVTDSRAYYTTDSGATWTATNLPALTPIDRFPRAYRMKADRKNPNKVYAYDSGGAWYGTPGKVYVSTDGGHTFTLSQGSVNANLRANPWSVTSMEVNPNVEGDIWLADGNDVYHSVDSGATWTKLNAFASLWGDRQTWQWPDVQGARVVALGKAQPGSAYSAAIYVVGVRDGVWGIYHSDDFGATWARFNDDAHQYAGVGAIAGDWNTYGRIYFSGTGRGVIYTN